MRIERNFLPIVQDIKRSPVYKKRKINMKNISFFPKKKQIIGKKNIISLCHGSR